LFALAISVTEIMVITFQQNHQIGDLNYSGIILGLLAGLAYAGFIIVSKKALSSYSSQTVAFYSYFVATIILFPFVIGTDLSAGSTSWILLLFLGVFNTGFAVTLYLAGIARVKTQKGVIITYLEPVGAVVFGFLFLAQQPTPLMLVGGLFILIAGYIVVSR